MSLPIRMLCSTCGDLPRFSISCSAKGSFYFIYKCFKFTFLHFLSSSVCVWVASKKLGIFHVHRVLQFPILHFSVLTLLLENCTKYAYFISTRTQYIQNIYTNGKNPENICASCHQLRQSSNGYDGKLFCELYFYKIDIWIYSHHSEKHWESHNIRHLFGARINKNIYSYIVLTKW